MPEKLVFISDFFANQVNGGGELNDWELIGVLSSLGNSVVRYQSEHVNSATVRENIKTGNKFIISNFKNMRKKVIDLISEEAEYVIIEHDHKYLDSRNPGIYPNYKVPSEKIINRDFYKKAKAVFCQSSFHKEIIQNNLDIDNIISLSGNLWSVGILSLLGEMSKVEKEDCCAIVDSVHEHKNVGDAISYCKHKNLKYELIGFSRPDDFLKKMGKFNALVFFPKSPETLSRVVVEARMMGMKTMTTKNVGAIHEEWFSKKGPDLIDEMRNKRIEIPKRILESLK